MWKGILIRTADVLKITPPSRRQSFVIRASCEVENTQAQGGTFSVLIPIPQRTPFQIVHREIEWTDSGIEIKREESYGNAFCLWRGKLEGYQKRKCEYIARVTVVPTSSIFLEPTIGSCRESSSLSVSDPRVANIAKELLHNNPTSEIYIRRVYEYVLSRLTYGKPIEGLYTAIDALTLPQVDCGGFSTLLISILRAGGISARMVSGFLAPSLDKNSMHVWVEASIFPGHWIGLDPSTDYLFRKGRSFRRSGRFGFIGSDHVVYSYGCDLTLVLDGQRYTTPLLQHPFFLLPSQGLTISSQGDITKQ